MRFLPTFCISFLVLALTVGGTAADASTIGSATGGAGSGKILVQKPRGAALEYKIGTTDGTVTEANCTKAHGVITTNADGSKTCTVPAGAVTTINTGKSNSF